MPFNLKLNNHIKELHFKIMHSIIGLNKLLYKMKIIESPQCSFCALYDETIEIFFVDCLVVKTFWFFCKFLLTPYRYKFEISFSSILLHHNQGKMIENEVINTFLLFAKIYIYKCTNKLLRIEINCHYAPFCWIKQEILTTNLWISVDRNM